jgi:hypothetical protein
VGIGAAVLPSSAHAERVLPVRTFAAKIIAGTGRYAKATGSTRIEVTVTPRPAAFGTSATQPEYVVETRLDGNRCSAHKGRRGKCLRLSGTITGGATLLRHEPFISDLPSTLLLRAATGTIAPIGLVAAVGTFRGTGYIYRGRQAAWMSLTTPHGTLSIGGVGPVVGGFQFP